jgi:hypothetical protein
VPLARDSSVPTHPADNHFGTLAIGPQGYLTGGKGDRFFVRRDFAVRSARREAWETSEAELSFAGSARHSMSLTGRDDGPSGSGFEHNFSWGVLRLAAGESLSLIDGNDAPGGELYVGELDLADGLDIERHGALIASGSRDGDATPPAPGRQRRKLHFLPQTGRPLPLPTSGEP